MLAFNDVLTCRFNTLQQFIFSHFANMIVFTIAYRRMIFFCILCADGNCDIALDYSYTNIACLLHIHSKAHKPLRGGHNDNTSTY